MGAKNHGVIMPDGQSSFDPRMSFFNIESQPTKTLHSTLLWVPLSEVNLKPTFLTTDL